MPPQATSTLALLAPKEWTDVHLLPWTASDYTGEDVEGLLSKLPSEFKTSARTFFTDVSKSYGKSSERNLSVLVAFDIKRKTGGRRKAVETLLNYILIDRLLSSTSAATTRPLEKVERTRFTLSSTERALLCGLEELGSWQHELTTRSAELEEAVQSQQLSVTQTVDQNNSTRFQRLLTTMDGRETLIKLQVSLLNMESAAYYLYSLSQGLSDLPNTSRKIPSAKIRNAFHYAITVSPLVLLMGQAMQNRALPTATVKVWYHLGNQRPPELAMVEQALWQQILHMALEEKSSEAALHDFLTAYRAMHPVAGWSHQSRNFFRKETGVDLEEFCVRCRQLRAPTPFPDDQALPAVLPDIKGAFIVMEPRIDDEAEDNIAAEGQGVGSSPTSHTGVTSSVSSSSEDAGNIINGDPSTQTEPAATPTLDPTRSLHSQGDGNVIEDTTPSPISRMDVDPNSSAPAQPPATSTCSDPSAFVEDSGVVDDNASKPTKIDGVEPMFGPALVDGNSSAPLPTSSASGPSTASNNADEDHSTQDRSSSVAMSPLSAPTKDQEAPNDESQPVEMDVDEDLSAPLPATPASVISTASNNADAPLPATPSASDLSTASNNADEDNSPQDMSSSVVTSSESAQKSQPVEMDVDENSSAPLPATPSASDLSTASNNADEDHCTRDTSSTSSESPQRKEVEAPNDELHWIDTQNDPVIEDSGRALRSKTKAAQQSTDAQQTVPDSHAAVSDGEEKLKKKPKKKPKKPKKKPKKKNDQPQNDKEKMVQDGNAKAEPSPVTDDVLGVESHTESGIKRPPLLSEEPPDREIFIGKTYLIPHFMPDKASLVYAPHRYELEDVLDFEMLATLCRATCSDSLSPRIIDAGLPPTNDNPTVPERARTYKQILAMPFHQLRHAAGDLQSLFGKKPLVIFNGPHSVDGRTMEQTLRSLGNTLSRRTVHDLSLSGISDEADYVHRTTTLSRVLAEIQRPNPRPLNVLSLPGTVNNTWIPYGLSTDDVAYQHCNDIRKANTPALPTFVEDLKWGLFGTTQSFHRAHVDACGFGTVIGCGKGSKLVYILTPPDTNDWREAASLEFFRGLKFSGENSLGWEVTLVLLRESDLIVMPPLTVHYVVTPETAMCYGGHFYCMSTMRRTCWALLHMVHRSDEFTNTSHDCHREILTRICLSSEPLADIPNLLTFTGILDFLHVLNIMDFGSALWAERYTSAKTIPQRDALLYASAREYGKQIMDWLKGSGWHVHRYTLDPSTNELVVQAKVSIDDIRSSFMVQQCATLLRQAKECRIPTQSHVKTALKAELLKSVPNAWQDVETALRSDGDVLLSNGFVYRPSHAESYVWAHECPKQGPFYVVNGDRDRPDDHTYRSLLEGLGLRMPPQQPRGDEYSSPSDSDSDSSSDEESEGVVDLSEKRVELGKRQRSANESDSDESDTPLSWKGKGEPPSHRQISKRGKHC
ncbi:hypothetical protein VNI00_018846 [Paramarasmius palmivorus]|uniref:JmjC domain-containing protein n=1 Tax=Paramarasmius palmivorus TaxID=297713 RepID=A0AAW0ATA2_9AGAR